MNIFFILLLVAIKKDSVCDVRLLKNNISCPQREGNL